VNTVTVGCFFFFQSTPQSASRLSHQSTKPICSRSTANRTAGRLKTLQKVRATGFLRAPVCKGAGVLKERDGTMVMVKRVVGIFSVKQTGDPAVTC